MSQASPVLGADTDTPQISCVVPTHGRPGSLTRAIGSIAAQTLKPLEIVVGDDMGQTAVADEVARLSSTCDVPLRYVDTSGPGQSTAGRNRNTAAESAAGELLAFLDDDDVWAPEFLELTHRRLAAGDVQIVISWLSNRRGEASAPYLMGKEGRTADELLYNSDLSGSNFLVRADAYRQMGGFDPTLRVKNDTDFMVRFLDAGYSYGVVEQSLVERHSHQLGHLSSGGRARHAGLQVYLDRYGDRMSKDQHRIMRRVMHSALRGADSPLATRIYHSAAQLALTTPSELVVALRFRKIFGRRRMFN